MGYLDNAIEGISYNEFIKLINQHYSILKPYSEQIWNAIIRVNYDESQQKEVSDYRDKIICELDSFNEMLNLTLLFGENKLKKVDLGKLGKEYYLNICTIFTSLIDDSLKEWHKILSEKSIDQNCLYVERYLKNLPNQFTVIKDGIISTDWLKSTMKTVRSIIKNLRAITRNEMKISILVSKFNEMGIPHKNSYYRDIYDVLDRLCFIPSETKEAHKKAGSPYYRENYIKSFFNRIK